MTGVKWRGLVGAIFIMAVAGCAGTNQIEPKHATPGDPVVNLLNNGITQLNLNINALSKRMNDAQEASAGTDPMLQELQALDQSGWHLHQQQWVLQRNHLIFARDILEQAAKNPAEKGPLLSRWREEREGYLKALEKLRQERRRLESTHLDAEARLVEHGLQ